MWHGRYVGDTDVEDPSSHVLELIHFGSWAPATWEKATRQRSVWEFSTSQGPQYRPPNSRALITRRLTKKTPQIYGDSRLPPRSTSTSVERAIHSRKDRAKPHRTQPRELGLPMCMSVQVRTLENTHRFVDILLAMCMIENTCETQIYKWYSRLEV